MLDTATRFISLPAKLSGSCALGRCVLFVFSNT